MGHLELSHFALGEATSSTETVVGITIGALCGLQQLIVDGFLVNLPYVWLSRYRAHFA